MGGWTGCGGGGGVGEQESALCNNKKTNFFIFSRPFDRIDLDLIRDSIPNERQLSRRAGLLAPPSPEHIGTGSQATAEVQLDLIKMRDGKATNASSDSSFMCSTSRPSRPLLNKTQSPTSSSTSCCSTPRIPSAALSAPRRRPTVRARANETSGCLQRASREGRKRRERKIFINSTARVVAARLPLPVAARDACLLRRRPGHAVGESRRLLGRGRRPARAGLGRVLEVRFVPGERRRCRCCCCC